MEISYQLNRNDFYKAFIAHRNRNRLAKWSLRILFGIVSVFAAVGLLLMLVERSFERITTFLPLFGIALVWVALMWLQPWWMARTQFTKQPSAQGTRILVLNENGVSWQWDGGTASIAWKNLIRAVESATLFLLYSSPACFNIIPKRALSDDQLVDFRRLLAEHIYSGRRSCERR